MWLCVCCELGCGTLRASCAVLLVEGDRAAVGGGIVSVGCGYCMLVFQLVVEVCS